MSDPVRFSAVTPNHIVRDIAAGAVVSCDVLGGTIKPTVPEPGPFGFVWIERNAVLVFPNDPGALARARAQYVAPAFGGTATRFIAVEGVGPLHAHVAARVPIVMPLHTPWYGMREFAIHDPDGHLLTFAERVAAP